jgi:hypothetical protein
MELAGEDQRRRARVQLEAEHVEYHGRDYTPET